MKLIKSLIIICYIAIGVIAFYEIVFSGITLKQALRTNYDPVNEGFAGVLSKGYTFNYELPSGESIHYFFRYKDGEILVNDYFYKTQQISALGKQDSEIDYPIKKAELLYHMPANEQYVFVKIEAKQVSKHLILWLLYFNIACLGIIYGLWLLVKFLKNCHQNNFFVSENAAYLNHISWLVLSLIVFNYVMKNISHFVLVADFKNSPHINVPYQLEMNWLYLLMGLILFVFAKAFKAGVAIQDEHKLVI